MTILVKRFSTFDYKNTIMNCHEKNLKTYMIINNNISDCFCKNVVTNNQLYKQTIFPKTST